MQPDVRIVLRFWKKPKRRNKNNTYKSPENFSGRRSDYLPGIFVLYRYGYSGYKLVIVRYCHLVMGMVFDLIPIVIAWGTIALVIATYTPVFNWISYPMGLYMKLFGVKEAFAAAPATLVGFTDMFIPALLLGGISSVKTKFIVGVLSLVQIIYLTEVGTIIIKSEIPLNLWKLFLIFMERTLIAMPLIVLFANLFL